MCTPIEKRADEKGVRLAGKNRPHPLGVVRVYPTFSVQPSKADCGSVVRTLPFDANPYGEAVMGE